MGDSETLVEQLLRSNRRWKALALAACSALVLTVLFGTFAVARQHYQVEVERRHAMDAMARAAVQAATLGQPR